MKQIFILMATLLFSTTVMAQPPGREPFPIDRSFIPTLQFLQKNWTGDYWGVVPPERQRYHVSRTLQLRADMTYTNKTTIGNSEDIPTTVLLYEEGTYTYDGAGTLSFDVACDSTIDMKAWMADETKTYTVNKYSKGDEQNYIEQASFTYDTEGKGDESRLWVAFDQKFMSDQNQNMKAVYTMKATTGEGTAIRGIASGKSQEGIFFDLLGRKNVPARVVIVDGKKILKH